MLEKYDRIASKHVYDIATGKTSRGSRVVAVLESIPDVLRTYVRQTVIAAAFGMALLFMTVMGFDGLAVGYGQSAGLQDFVLGAFRSYGSAMGILGALSYAFFERRLGVRKTGLLGLTCQQICLIVAVISIWLPGSPFDPKGYFHGQSAQELKDIVEPKPTKSGQSLDSIITFLSEIATARFGLWMADLSIIHIMQEGVPESDRNTVFGVHNALCQTFSVLKDVLVIILPDPSTFGICILISYGFVTSGYFSFVYYLLKVNKH
nr:Ferroportin1 domain containing protein [Haemonchus contortus]